MTNVLSYPPATEETAVQLLEEALRDKGQPDGNVLQRGFEAVVKLDVKKSRLIESLKEQVADQRKELASTTAWFDGLLRIEAMLVEMGVWEGEDVASSEDPAKTLADGLAAAMVRVRDAAFSEGRASATETPESRAKAWDTFRESRAGYEAWLRNVPSDYFAPATFEEVMALYDRNSMPSFAEFPPVPEGKVLVDTEPDQALLASMAVCLDHGFGLNSEAHRRVVLLDMRTLFDVVVRYQPNAAEPPVPAVLPRKVLVGLLPSKALLSRMAACLRGLYSAPAGADEHALLLSVGKLFDEIVGQGYYSPEVRGRYLPFLPGEVAGGM